MSPASRPARGWLTRLVTCDDYDGSAWLGGWHCVYVVNYYACFSTLRMGFSHYI